MGGTDASEIGTRQVDISWKKYEKSWKHDDPLELGGTPIDKHTFELQPT